MEDEVRESWMNSEIQRGFYDFSRIKLGNKQSI